MLNNILLLHNKILKNPSADNESVQTTTPSSSLREPERIIGRMMTFSNKLADCVYFVDYNESEVQIAETRCVLGVGLVRHL